MFGEASIASRFDPEEKAVIHPGDCLAMLRDIQPETFRLVATSPPYNLGKEYEKKLDLEAYIAQQTEVIAECARVTARNGSICWQVGNYVDNGSIVPLDAVLYPIFRGLGLKMRNRIVWRFEHGLHCKRRFSGRYETICWFTKSDDYVFNLDPVRVPQKYPGKKHFKGPKAGKYSCNPLGKNPGDTWSIPNVKSNHVEKTEHPCQFPVELIERLVLSMTNEGDWVLDPFLGTGATIVAAILRGRRGAGAEVFPKYLDIARERVSMAMKGALRTRPMGRPVHDPSRTNTKLTVAPWNTEENRSQLSLFENPCEEKER